MLQMKIRTNDDLNKNPSSSPIKTVESQDVNSSDHLDELIKSVQALMQTRNLFSIFRVAG